VLPQLEKYKTANLVVANPGINLRTTALVQGLYSAGVVVVSWKKLAVSTRESFHQENSPTQNKVKLLDPVKWQKIYFITFVL
jgi:hypothetical protein